MGVCKCKIGYSHLGLYVNSLYSDAEGVVIFDLILKSPVCLEN